MSSTIALAAQRYLTGDTMTEADIRLVTTLLRFDIVYVGHFKCNIRRIADYPAITRYLDDMLALDAVASTFRPDHIKNHYYRSHLWINPDRCRARRAGRCPRSAGGAMSPATGRETIVYESDAGDPCRRHLARAGPRRAGA